MSSPKRMWWWISWRGIASRNRTAVRKWRAPRSPLVLWEFKGAHLLRNFWKDYQYCLSKVESWHKSNLPLVNGETSPALIAADDEGYSGVDKGNEEEYELKGSTWVNMWPPWSMGDDSDDDDAPISTFDPARGLRSMGGCCSTGRKMHSFFNRMQLAHRPCGSSGAAKHRIFRRLQCPEMKTLAFHSTFKS